MDDANGSIDMAEHTGGHYLDTGDGPTRLDPPAPERVPSEADIAWQTYTAHRLACSQCRSSVFRCGEGDDLWNGVAAL